MRRKYSTVWAAIFGLVIAALFPVAAQQAAAQETNPMPAISDYGIPASAPSAQSQAAPRVKSDVTKPPSYCKPCLYYSGDFDGTNADSNGVSNENDEIVDLSQIYTPFAVPSGKKWKVTGVFFNSLMTAGVLDPVTTEWSIWTGVSAGHPGTLLAAGAGKGKLKATGRSFVGFTEYTTSVSSSVTLPCGTYWVNVLPQCTNTSDSDCTDQRFFLSGVADTSPAEHYGGTNITSDSFINSNFFGYNYELTNGIGSCTGTGCELFSFGVVGTATSGPKCL